jgi:hypothetical protein
MDRAIQVLDRDFQIRSRILQVINREIQAKGRDFQIRNRKIQVICKKIQEEQGLSDQK